MKFATCAACLVAVQVLAVAGAGAAPPKASQPAPAPAATFKAGVELVRLDVQVTNSHGQPIRDLRRGEVQVFESGKPRPVLFFQHIEPQAAPYLDAAQHTIGGEVSTNQGAPRGHLYVLVFDQSHLSPGGALLARKAADRFLRTKLRPGDRVAVYGLPAPGPHLTFTGDVSLAERELMGVHGGAESVGMGGLGAIRVAEAYEILRGDQMVLNRVANGNSKAAGSNQNLLFDVPRETVDNPTVFRELVVQNARTIVSQADQQTRQFLDSLVDLFSSLRLIEGRKTVILFSNGFFDDNVSDQLERVSAAAARSYAVIESMDMNNRTISATRVGGGLGNDRGLEVADQIAPLSALAVATDGRFYPDAAGWIDRSLDSLAAPSQDYYLVGFEPAADATGQRNGYYPVTVKVTRPGAHVSTRTGFALALPPAPGDRRQAINAVLDAPFPEQDVPIRYTTYQLRGSSVDRQRVVLSVSAELPLASPAKSRADVVFVVRDATDGRVAASGTDTFPLPTRAEPGDTRGIGRYHVQFDVPPGDYLMRVIVRSPDGLVGSADRRFSVRPLGGPGVTASDLILGVPRVGHLPVEAVAYASDMLQGFVDLYARVPAQLQDASVDFTLSPLDGRERSAVTIRGQDAPVMETLAGPTRAVEFALPLNGVPPGAYLARARVRADGETVGEVAREVEVRSGAAPAFEVAAASAPGTVDPADVLKGAIVQQYLESVRAAVPADTPIARAANLALSADWNEIEAVLPAAATGDDGGRTAALRGLAAIARHDYRAASERLRAALGLAPKDARLAFFLGWADMGAGDPPGAIGDWRNAITVDPTFVPAYLALTDAYLSLSQPALAEQVLRAGLRALPESPELQARLSRLTQGR